MPRQNNVRSPWQAFPVQPEPVAHPVQQRSNNHFRLGVLSPNPAHVPASALFGQPVSHTNVFPVLLLGSRLDLSGQDCLDWLDAVRFCHVRYIPHFCLVRKLEYLAALR
jgi:hypothetical protein